MKRNYVSIIFTVFIAGVLIGILAKDYNNQDTTYINKDKIIKKEIKASRKEVKRMNKEKEQLEKEIEKLKLSLKTQNPDINKELNILKEKLGYTEVKGDGLKITIDSINDEAGNIANMVDYNKILIKLINELKVNGAEFISINNQRINQYSEISLAGSHININSTPIAQPYNISVIGNLNKLNNYIIKKSTYLSSIDKNYDLKVNCKIEKNLSIEKMSIINKLYYIEGE